MRDLREQTEATFQTEIRAAVVGRPVRFVGAAKDEDNAFAEQRLLEALHLAGFERVRFELEPVAAAHFYESTLDHDELILIGDFGGGTSDFSLIRVGPSFRAGRRKQSDLLGNAGVALAGDAFDARIVRHLVSPALGAGTEMRSFGKVLPVPIAVYSKLERWHYLSMLRNNQVLAQLDRVRAQAEEPRKIQALIHLIKSDLGYQLHRAVQALKYELSQREAARFQFRDEYDRGAYGNHEGGTMLGGRSWDDWIAQYASSHQHPVNRFCHTVGIPLIVLSLALAIVALYAPGLWAAVLVLFVGGWILQFVGHAFEGKAPEFFHDWRFLFVGLRWWLAKIRGRA